jgi:hypothetical protein
MALQGEEYKLMWKPTVDFVRMASRLNAIIVPFGILGADEAYVQIDTLLGHHCCQIRETLFLFIVSF